MRKKGRGQTATRRAAASYTTKTAVRRRRSTNAAARRENLIGAAAPRKASIETTEELITDAETIKSIESGLSDLEAGRVKPWSKVKRNV